MRMARALRKSIKHWYRNLILALSGSAAEMKIKAEDCPLCIACGYRKVGDTVISRQDCARCPVARKVGRGGCFGTPWTAVVTLKDSIVLDGMNLYPKLVRATEKMINFLESFEEREAA
jgi:hypothetical protein